MLYLSLGQVALHDVAGERPGKAWYGTAVGTLLAAALALSVVGWAVALSLFAVTGGDAFKPISLGILVLSLGLLPFLIWEQYGSALLAIAGRLRVYNRAQAVGRSIGVAAVAVLLWAGAGVPGVIVGTLVGQVIVAGGGIRGLAALGDGLRPSRALAAKLIGGGARLHLSAVGTVLITSADVLIVGHYRGAAAVGAYQLATQALYALMLMPQAATLVIYEHMAEQGPQAAWEVQRRVVLVVLVAVVGLAGLGAAGAPVLVHLVAGNGFAGAAGLLRVVLLAAPSFALSALMAPQWIGRGLFGTASALTVLSGAANVVANVILVPRFGPDGAAATLVGTALLMFAPNAYLAFRCERARAAHLRGPDESTQPSRRAAG
jgi:O-antigen/teichoic acid export membrane protein